MPSQCQPSAAYPKAKEQAEAGAEIDTRKLMRGDLARLVADLSRVQEEQLREMYVAWRTARGYIADVIHALVPDECPDDPLSDGRLRDQERPGDLVGGESAEQSERERHAGLLRKNRMTGDEHEA